MDVLLSAEEDPEVEEAVVDVVVNVTLNAVAAIPSKAFAYTIVPSAPAVVGASVAPPVESKLVISIN